MKRTLITAAIAAMFTFGAAQAQFVQSQRGYGPGNGAGNQRNGPKDGTGHGAKAGKRNPSGTCDQTGPKRQGQGQGQRGNGNGQRGGAQRGGGRR